jgi:hypothetical protein
VQPFLVPGGLRRQPLRVFVNGTQVARLVLRRPEAKTLVLSVPPWLFTRRNQIELRLPNARPMADFWADRHDREALGMAVWWIELH